MRWSSLFLLALLLLCVRKEPYGGVVIRLESPGEVRRGEEFEVYLDLSNEGEKSYEIKLAEIFDVGAFNKSGECKITNVLLRPYFLKSLDCKLRAPVETLVERSRIEARVIYSTNLSLFASVEALSEEEYKKRVLTNKLKKGKQVFVKRDDAASLKLSLEKAPVLIGEQAHAWIEISNVGNGMLLSADLEVKTVPEGVLSCSAKELKPVNGKFPRIACTFNFREQRNYLNVLIEVILKYNYEVRKSVEVRVIR